MFYEIHGQQHRGTVLMSSGLGGSHSYWAPQIKHLSRSFRVIVYDHFGTGSSPGDIAKGYDIADMADEVLALLDQADTERVHFVGHALGGLVGLQLAVEHPTRITSLVAINAWLKTDQHTLRCFEIRKALLRQCGLAMFLRAQPLFLYPAQWIKDHSDILDGEANEQLNLSFSEDNLLRRIDAVERFDFSDQITRVTCPTGLIASQDDLLVPYSCSAVLHRSLCLDSERQETQARLYTLPRGGHACNVTEPELFNSTLDQFYKDIKGERE
jgi:aminoacrylate hydrolase